MAATATARQPAQDVPPQRKAFWACRWWIILALAAVAAPIIYAALLLVYWPFTQQAVIDVLQERSVRSVTINHFYRSIGRLDVSRRTSASCIASTRKNSLSLRFANW